jgi:hypothetical protein
MRPGLALRVISQMRVGLKRKNNERSDIHAATRRCACAA